ncbi:MAG TPA: site-specific DNA-methyltransferase [Armatimonadetes bacterium]|nr:site-specific DNA-methyltransferase [Armatimonadota bacterium]
MPQQQPLDAADVHISSEYEPDALVTLYEGDRLDLLKQIPDGAASLVVTSPPYNLGKDYEENLARDTYVTGQAETIAEATRICAEDGSICWQVGNYVENGTIMPLDILLYPIFSRNGLKLRNRIVWHFGHGLHCSKRFSGRYEVILWFTKTDDYYFDLDAVRVPQKYPGKKYYKGDKAGELSCNPKGKNPADVWDMPNVKSNHREKTEHPCQFPIALIERLVLSMTRPGDLVVDPYMGVGSTAVAALLNGRRAAGADVMPAYLEIARERVRQAIAGTVPYRPLDKPIYDPALPNGGHD